MYATPTVPAGRVVVVTLTLAAIVKVSGCTAVMLLASVTWTTKVAVPAAAGIPEMVPPEERLKPEGKEPTVIDHRNGDLPPDTDKVAL